MYISYLVQRKYFDLFWPNIRNPAQLHLLSLPDISAVVAVPRAALVGVLVDAQDGVGVGLPGGGEAEPDVVLDVRPEDVALEVRVVPFREGIFLAHSKAEHK